MEHYLSFVRGLERQRVDYDARFRDLRISSNREFAQYSARQICSDLESISHSNIMLEIKLACSLGLEKDAPWSVSNVKRELQYLQAHTIHHYAIISMIMRLLDLHPDSNLGATPSTLHHRKLGSPVVAGS